MKKDCYVYPAIFTYEDDGISVEFPDLPGCLTCADTTEEAIKMANKRDIIVLAGKGHEPYQEINGTKYPFDERIIVKEIIG